MSGHDDKAKKHRQRSLSDLLPAQDHYYLLTNGSRWARHGTADGNGLLVFANLERAEQFCMTVGKRLPFKPVKVPAEVFLALAEDIGAICVAEGVTVRVATIHLNREDVR